MTQEEIIELAKQAGFADYELDDGTTHAFDKRYEAFARLVAKHTLLNTDPSSFMSYQEGVEVGRLAEREACAKVCDAMEEKAEGTECCKWPTPIDCAHAIRARGQE